MTPINGREPEPLGTRGLAAKLQKQVDAKLLSGLGTNPWPQSQYDVKNAICAAAGEMMESELLALAVGWGKRFAELEERLKQAERRLERWGQ